MATSTIGTRAALRVLFLMLALSVSAPVAAQEQEYTIHGTDIRIRVHVQQTAGELYERCQFDADAPSPDAFICAGYLSGAEDGMRIIWAASGEASAFCAPDGTERRVLLQTFSDYVRAHPEKRDLPAALVVLQAYRESFPCTRQPPH